jgi:ligand-binding sensor domain-containing protein/signal transduction histidine kinase
MLAGTCVGAETESPVRSPIELEFEQRVWQQEHGLPAGNRVFSILQTRDGYLWVGTQQGLARFDGQNFTVFDRLNTPALASDDCRTLAEDLEGNLWIGTVSALIRKSGPEFTSFASELGVHSWGHGPLCSSRTGGVWVGAVTGICRIRGDHVSVHLPHPEPPIGLGLPTAIQEDVDGTVWLGTETGLFRFDPASGQFAVGDREPNQERAPVFDLWLADNGDLWILFAEFVYAGRVPTPATWIACLKRGDWPKAPTVFRRFDNPGWNHHAILGDATEGLWLLGNLPWGIQRYRNGAVEFLPMPRRDAIDVSLSASFDREGNLWIGTGRSGLQRLTPRRITTYSTADGLAHDNVWSIFEGRDGSMWVGTDGGVTRLKAGQSTLVTRADGSVQRDVRAVAEDRDGNLWVGTMRSLECTRDGVTRPVQFPGEWFETKIRVLLPGQDGSMWVGTVRGLTRLQGDQRTKYTRAEGLGSDEVRALLEDRAGNLWVGTLGGGLSRLHDGRFTTFTTADGLPSNNVWALHEDPEGALWIGTDNGLTRLLSGRFTTLSQAHGLPDPLVNSIVADNLGQLWIGHDRGIYVLEREQVAEVARQQRTTLRVVSYDESDGLLSVETNGQKSNPTACKSRDGRLWFPTTHGIAILDPSQVRTFEIAPLSAIEEVRANGRTVWGSGPILPEQPERLTSRHGLQFDLPAGGARVLEFHFTANTLVAPDKARFSYRLIGLDDSWIDADTRRQAYFTDLRPGKYRFELLACNHQGLWQEASVAVAFYVAPFYHETIWFRAGGGLGLALLVGWAIRWRWRESRHLAELERINALNDQRRQIARDIHDEVGASLTHILQLSGPSRGSATPRDRSELSAERIASIASEAVDSIGEIVWANNPEYDTLEDLVAYLREYAANFFADTDTELVLEFPDLIPSGKVTGLFRRHLVLLLKEALQNVSRHAHSQRVKICLTVGAGQLELTVADDGLGLPPDGVRRAGNGLTNMKQRVAELGGTFELHSQFGAGTEIRVVVPLTG